MHKIYRQQYKELVVYVDKYDEGDDRDALDSAFIANPDKYYRNTKNRVDSFKDIGGDFRQHRVLVTHIDSHGHEQLLIVPTIIDQYRKSASEDIDVLKTQIENSQPLSEEHANARDEYLEAREDFLQYCGCTRAFKNFPSVSSAAREALAECNLQKKPLDELVAVAEKSFQRVKTKDRDYLEALEEKKSYMKSFHAEYDFKSNNSDWYKESFKSLYKSHVMQGKIPSKLDGHTSNQDIASYIDFKVYKILLRESPSKFYEMLNASFLNDAEKAKLEENYKAFRASERDLLALCSAHHEEIKRWDSYLLSVSRAGLPAWQQRIGMLKMVNLERFDKVDRFTPVVAELSKAQKAYFEHYRPTDKHWGDREKHDTLVAQQHQIDFVDQYLAEYTDWLKPMLDELDEEDGSEPTTTL